MCVLQMDGEVGLPEGKTEQDGVRGDFRLLMEIPFMSVHISVPVNASDPLAAGRAIAAKEIGLKDGARTFVEPFDPERAKGPFAARLF
jgi:hypothetical protein